MKRNGTIIKEINKIFPPIDPDLPVCFMREGENRVLVTSERYARMECDGVIFGSPVVDYYLELYQNSPSPGIEPKLVKYADKLGAYWEWENPACIILCR